MRLLTITLLLTLNAEASVGPATVAVILPLTGPYADVARNMRAAVELARETLPALQTNRLDFAFLDNYACPDSARATAERLADQPEVVAFFAGFPDRCGAAVKEVAERRGVPYLIVASSADALTLGYNRYTFRLSPPSSELRDGIFAWAATVVGVRRPVAVTASDDPRFSDETGELLSGLAKVWKGKVTTHTFAAGTDDFCSLLDELSREEPTLVWLVGSEGDIGRFLVQCRETGWMPAAFVFGAVEADSGIRFASSDRAADFIYRPAIWWSDAFHPRADDFVRRFSKRTGEAPDFYAAAAYAGVQLLAAAFRESGADRDRLRAELARTDLQTVIGRVRFERFREFVGQNRMRTVALQLQFGRWRTVWPPELAETKFIYPVPVWRDPRRTDIAGRKSGPNYLIVIAGFGVLIILLILYRRDMARRGGN